MVPYADVIFMANLDREHHNSPNLATDKEGRATLLNLIPGVKYWVEHHGTTGSCHKEFTAQPGEMDLGEIKLLAREQ